MNHYTYELRHKNPVGGHPYRYIGVHSCEGNPFEDMSYWGSSRHTPKDVKETHNKLVLQVFPTRTEAVEHEVMLHNKYEVGVNPDFYNQAKQTSTKFDTSGTTGWSKGKKRPELYGKPKPEGSGNPPKTYDMYIHNFFGESKHLLWQRITNMTKFCIDNPEYNRGALGATARGERIQHKGIFAVEVTNETN